MSDLPDSQTSRPRRSDEDDAKVWRRFTGISGEDAKASPVHRLKIAGQAPEGFGLHLRRIVPPDPMRGEAILAGRWRIGMERVVLPGGEAPWGDTLPSRHFADRLHRFDWLADLLTLNEGGADRARILLDDWISNFGRFDGFSWRIGCAADRVWNWMRCGAQIFEVGTEAECALRLETLQRQIKHVLALASSTSDTKAAWRASVIDVAQSISLARGKQLDDALYNLETLCTAHQAEYGR
ncbi:MAG: heparinase, partial [Pseudomonadota bacterium]